MKISTRWGGVGSLYPPISQCLNAGGMGRQDAETETLIPTIGCVFDVAHTLKGEGFDASEDGTGRGTPLVPVAVPLQEIGKRTGVSTDDPRAGIGIGQDGDPMFTLQAGAQHGVAYEPYTLAIRGRGDSHNLEYRQDGTSNALLTPNGGRAGIGVGAVAAFKYTMGSKACGIGYAEEQSPTLDTRPESNAVLSAMQVRRLTPVECERLQGFPDNYTQIPWRKNPAEECPDGPRYKALGNSMAVPCMRWIGTRIANALA